MIRIIEKNIEIIIAKHLDATTPSVDDEESELIDI